MGGLRGVLLLDTLKPTDIGCPGDRCRVLWFDRCGGGRWCFEFFCVLFCTLICALVGALFCTLIYALFGALLSSLLCVLFGTLICRLFDTSLGTLFGMFLSMFFAFYAFTWLVVLCAIWHVSFHVF